MRYETLVFFFQLQKKCRSGKDKKLIKGLYDKFLMINQKKFLKF